MRAHVSDEQRNIAVDWIMRQKNRGAAVRAVAKKWRVHEATVRTWLRKGPVPVVKLSEFPDVPAGPSLAPTAPASVTPGAIITKIPLATEAERATAELERGPEAAGSTEDAIARASGAASSSDGRGERPESESGPDAPPSPVAPMRASQDDIDLVLDVVQTAKSGVVKLVAERMRPAPGPEEWKPIAEITPPLRIALEANADWIAPKFRAVLESGVWALVGAAIIDGVITFAGITSLARKVVARRGPEAPHDAQRPEDEQGSAI